MVTIGVSDECLPNYSFRRTDDGLLIPDATVAEIHADRTEQIQRQFEIGQLVDDQDLDYIVFPEQHFPVLGNTSPNPMYSQTAIAQRTDSVRLLQMANIPLWHDPVRLAEEIAVLDTVSDGRVEVGVTKGDGVIEQAVFDTRGEDIGTSEAEKEARFLESYELLTESLAADTVEYKGEFHTVPPGHLREGGSKAETGGDSRSMEPDCTLSLPASSQSPRPPFWRPTMSEESLRWAARRGVNGCTHCRDFSALAERVDIYREAAAAANWPDCRQRYDGSEFARGWDATRRRGVVPIVPVFDTDVADERTTTKVTRHLAETYIGDGEGDSYELADVKRQLADDGLDAPVVGGTDQIVERLQSLRRTVEYDDLAVFVQTKYRGMSHAANIEQIESLATDVVPRLDS